MLTSWLQFLVTMRQLLHFSHNTAWQKCCNKKSRWIVGYLTTTNQLHQLHTYLVSNDMKTLSLSVNLKHCRGKGCGRFKSIMLPLPWKNSGTYPTSTQCVQDTKRKKCETGYLLPPNTEVKNTWSYTSTTPYVVITSCLFKHRRKGIFICWHAPNQR